MQNTFQGLLFKAIIFFNSFSLLSAILMLFMPTEEPAAVSCQRAQWLVAQEAILAFA